jgi:RNA 2',3'-cyclic 3'-phosphodiesterase
MMNEPRSHQPAKGLRKRQRYRKERPAAETVSTDWRLFLAIPMPEGVRERIRALIDRLEPRAWPMRWVDPDSAHLTLHFLGDTPPEQAEILRLALGPVVSHHLAFNLRTAGLGVFPKLKRPRVLWLGIWGPAHRLEAIYNDLGDLLDEMLFPIEEKPFSPHVTLGRVRGGHSVPLRDLSEQLRSAIDEMAADGLADPDDGLNLPIEEVLLMRSHLDHAGSRHEVIERFPLASRETSVG